MVTLLANGRYRVESGGREYVADAVRHAGAVWVWIDGQLFVVADAVTKTRDHRADELLSPPMSAKVIRIAVAPGQSVTKGEPLVILEAMKMELPIRSPRDGVIKAVHCAEGDLVQPGVALVELGELE
jgi:3-methylcrotonyl-CoA carboxylase alpha subunit